MSKKEITIFTKKFDKFIDICATIATKHMLYEWKYRKSSVEPDLNQRPMDISIQLLQSTALPTELSTVMKHTPTFEYIKLSFVFWSCVETGARRKGAAFFVEYTHKTLFLQYPSIAQLVERWTVVEDQSYP